MTVRSTTALALLLAAVALAVIGCGGGDGQETSTAATAGAAQEQASNGEATGGRNAQNGAGRDGQGSDAGGEQPQGDSAGTDGPQAGSKAPAPGVPTTKGGDNSIQTFGAESRSGDRAQAAAALQAYLDARAAGEWARACSQLSSGARELLAKFAERGQKLEGQGCAGVMAAFAEGVPPSVLAAEAQIEVLSFRVEGDSAFLIYEGPPDTVSAIPMAQEDGAWKVGAIGATPLL